MSMGKGKIYVVVNKQLGMSTGKVAAQVAHVVSRLKIGVPRTVIVLQGTGDQLNNLNLYLSDNNIPNVLYIDEGANEVPPMSMTALAFGKSPEDEVPDFIKDFDLYSDYEPEVLNKFGSFVLGVMVAVIGGIAWLKLMTP